MEAADGAPAEDADPPAVDETTELGCAAGTDAPTGWPLAAPATCVDTDVVGNGAPSCGAGAETGAELTAATKPGVGPATAAGAIDPGGGENTGPAGVASVADRTGAGWLVAGAVTPDNGGPAADGGTVAVDTAGVIGGVTTGVPAAAVPDINGAPPGAPATPGAVPGGAGTDTGADAWTAGGAGAAALCPGTKPDGTAPGTVA